MRTTKTGNAAIYTRISLDRQDGAGIARQEADCRDLAARQGLKVARVYSDNSVSAYSGVKRPAFEQLIADVDSGSIGTVVVWATDRLYRRLTDLERLVDTLGSTPVLAVKSGRVDLSTADGRMNARLLGSVAQHSSEKTAERVAARAQQRAEQELRVTTGARPFGWRWRLRPDGKRDLEPEPSEAAAVVESFDLFVRHGWTLSAIARRMTDLGHTTREGGPVRQTTVRKWLTMPRNGGVATYKREPVGDLPGGGLVDRSLWERAQAILADPDRRPKRGGTHSSLFGGSVLVCSVCGSKMLAASNNGRKRRDGTTPRYRTYACHPARHVNVARDKIDGPLVDVLCDELGRQADVLLAAAPVAADDTAAEISALSERRDAYDAAVTDGTMPLARYDRLIGKIEDRLAKLEQQRRRELARPVASDVLGDQPDLVADRLRDLAAHDVAAFRTVVAELVEAVTVRPARDGGGFDVTWRQS